ncbi:MAG: 3-deoxy-manno-octulosonate cytidylyltransferase [Pseudomonadota bacterium]
MANVLTLIPARMAANRLPGKPLAEIAGEPMIVHVWRRAVEAGLGRVVVAADDPAIVAACETVGAEAVMTRNDHPSGSDRIWEAAEAIDPGGEFETILNLQGDLPTLEPELPRACLAPLEDEEVDIATLGVAITDANEATNPNVVKIVGTPVDQAGARLRALYFTRATAPYGEGPLYHHVGIYAYRRQALQRYVSLPPSTLERRERLEQLRALEDGMRIDAAVVTASPLGVDTPQDLAKARAILETV